MDKNIGKKLDGRYEITELIGVGGMAEVYKGVDVIDNKTVAIKILKKEYAEKIIPCYCTFACSADNRTSEEETHCVGRAHYRVWNQLW